MTGRRFWTTVEINRLREMAGEDPDVVAAELGRSRSAVQHKARELDVVLGHARNPIHWSESTRARALARIQVGGEPITEVSRTTGIPIRTLSRWNNQEPKT